MWVIGIILGLIVIMVINVFVLQLISNVFNVNIITKSGTKLTSPKKKPEKFGLSNDDYIERSFNRSFGKKPQQTAADIINLHWKKKGADKKIFQIVEKLPTTDKKEYAMAIQQNNAEDLDNKVLDKFFSQ